MKHLSLELKKKILKTLQDGCFVDGWYRDVQAKTFPFNVFGLYELDDYAQLEEEYEDGCHITGIIYRLLLNMERTDMYVLQTCCYGDDIETMYDKPRLVEQPARPVYIDEIITFNVKDYNLMEG
jgi:hypothetical protein